MPSAEEVGAARLALELAAERMGTNPELVERERAARERAERERDQMVEVLAFLPETQRQDALVLASYRGEVYKVSRLLDAGADKDGEASEALRGMDGMTPLAAAAWGGHLTVVNKLLVAGADPGKHVTSRGGSRFTPLVIAVDCDNVACVKRLLEVPGVDVEAQDNLRYTALHYASRSWNHECMRLLLDKGASVDVRAGSHDITPLHAVSDPGRDISDTEMQSCEHCVRLLLGAGANKDAQDNEGDTPLMIAIRGNRSNLVRMLLDAECKVDLANVNGNTPLLLAAIRNHPDIVKMLLKAGANKMPVNSGDKTAFQLAEEKGHTQLMALLRDE